MRIRILTKEEKKILFKMHEERGWDPDVRALTEMLNSLDQRLDEALSDTNLLDLAQKVLVNQGVACIFFDIFGTGKVGCTRRSGLIGVGETLHGALRKMQDIDPKYLDRRGVSEPGRSSEHKNEDEPEE